MTMTDDDLVKRLLVGACAQNDVAWSLMREAAGRIEQLTAERDRAYASGYSDAETEISKSALGQRNAFLHSQYANAADHIKVLTADNARLKDMADKCTSIAKDAISMCNEGHPVSAKNVALAIIRTLNTGKEVMPDGTSKVPNNDIGPGDQAVAGAALEGESHD
jgi:hypothetical protein